MSLDRFWRVTYHPARAYLLLRGLYLLLVADVWLGMIQHGGRYGIGGFNVAHFALLDRVVPLPTPTLYVGLLIACGLLALLLALGRAPRALRLVLAGLYTLSWMLSMHDSYQHHYLLSWLLLWCAALPEPSAAQGVEGLPARGWGLPMTAVSCAIVYTFTGISKTEAIWRSGYVLRALTHTRPPGDPSPGKFDAARDLLLGLGLSESTIWSAFSLSTITLQWVVAVGYLAAPARDERPSRWRAALTTLGLIGAVSFHAVAELFQVFEIGLFSYYMLGIALVLLGPARPLVHLVRPVAGISRASARMLDAVQSGSLGGVLIALVVCVLLALVGLTIPLPGAPYATAGVALLAIVWILLVVRRSSLCDARRIAAHVALATFAVWLSLTRTSVPFDYYRRTAGELQRMGRLEQALATYRIAERYAPEGSSRESKIRALEVEVGGERVR